MRILFDQGTPAPLRRFLWSHTVTTAEEAGWDRATDRNLLLFAEQAGFDVLVTTDQSLHSQQNLKKFRLAVVVIKNPKWAIVQRYVRRIAAAVNAASPGSYKEIEIPYR